MAKPAETKNRRPEKHIPPLPGGIVQYQEGIARCGACGREVVSARTPNGMRMSLSPVFGNKHDCDATRKDIHA